MTTARSSNARVHVLFAKKSSRAVAIVQARAKRFHIISFDTLNNVVKRGAWFSGTIFPLRSDLSWDGALLVYFARNPANKLYSWTAISKPPSLTAEVLWEKGDSWDGGGVFTGEHALLLNFHDKKDKGSIGGNKLFRNYTFSFNPYGGEDLPIFAARLKRSGWKGLDAALVKCARPFKLEKTVGKYNLTVTLKDPSKRKRTEPVYSFLYSLAWVRPKENPTPIELDEEVTWADFDAYNNFYFVRRGVIYKYAAGFNSENDLSWQLDCNLFSPPPPRKKS